MNKLIILFFSPFLLYSQNSIRYLDSKCLQEIDRAQINFNNEKYSYYYDDNEYRRSSQELIEDFKKFNINLVIPYFSDVVELSVNNSIIERCYDQYMNFLIEKKFTKTFLNKRRIEIDSIYILNNLDKVYGYNECKKKKYMLKQKIMKNK